MKVVVAAFNQEKALVGAFSVITNLRMELFEALVACVEDGGGVPEEGEGGEVPQRVVLGQHRVHDADKPVDIQVSCAT